METSEVVAVRPPPEKRFTPSRQEFAQNRLKAVQEVVEEMKKTRPEVLSFCIYGSMVYGVQEKQAILMEGCL